MNTPLKPQLHKHSVINRLFVLFGIKRNPRKISKRNRLLNRKIDYNKYDWGDYKRTIFSERLQVLIDNCRTYNQYYRCQTLLYKYIEVNGKYKEDGWIFFGNKISITVRALELQVNGITAALNGL